MVHGEQPLLDEGQIRLVGTHGSWRHTRRGEWHLSIVGSPWDVSGGLLEDEDVLGLLVRAPSLIACELAEELDRIRGFFAAVLTNGTVTMAVVDRLQSYPLFYARIAGELLISDDPHLLKEAMGEPIWEPQAVLQFALGGLVVGDSTLIRGLWRMEAGTLLAARDGEVGTASYYEYRPQSTTYLDQGDLSDWVKRFRQLTEETFDRIRVVIGQKGYVPVVPLSGGLDSRFLAASLRAAGLENVVCFTYGTASHQEVLTSRDVARRLGYEWRFCEYTPEKWRKYYAEEICPSFMARAGGLSAKPHFTEYIAVRELFDGCSGKLLFLPGHTLDHIAGGPLPHYWVQRHRIRTREVAQHIVSKHFGLHFAYGRDRAKLERMVRACLPHNRTMTLSAAISKLEWWDWKERQAKIIMNALFPMKCFGHDFYMPFWEKRWLEFFGSIPLVLKFGRRFFRYAAREMYPDLFPESDPVFHLSRKTRKMALKRHLLAESRSIPGADLLRYIGFRIGGAGTRAIGADYGLNRFGAFDTSARTLSEFARVLAAETDAKHATYPFIVDYLIAEGVDRTLIDERYWKIVESLRLGG